MVVSWPPCWVAVEVNTLPTLPSRPPLNQSWPVWSKKLRIWAHMLPKRVGVPKMMASASVICSVWPRGRGQTPAARPWRPRVPEHHPEQARRPGRALRRPPHHAPPPPPPPPSCKRGRTCWRRSLAPSHSFDSLLWTTRFELYLIEHHQK